MTLCIQNSDLSTRMTSLYGFQPSPVVLCMQNRDFRTRLTSLYGSQTSPVVLCMLNGVISTRITSLYGSQISPVILCTLNSVISTRITSLYGSQPSSAFFAHKTAPFRPELQVSMGPSRHLHFLHAKQRLFDQNYKSLWVPDLICCFVNEKQRDKHQNH